MLRSSIWVHFMTVLIFKNGILEFTSGFLVLTLMAFYKIKLEKKTIYGMVYIDFRAILALTESLNTEELVIKVNV